MINAESWPRTSEPASKPGHCEASSQTPAPAIRDPGNASRPLNTRAPLQVTPKDENSSTLGRSIERRSGTEPYRPYSITEIARIRCAEAHQATACTRLVCTHTSSSSRPRMASTSMVSRNSVLTSKDIHTGPIVRKTKCPFHNPCSCLPHAHSTNGEPCCWCVRCQDHG